ncbi:MAG: FHA domain-containing protein [Planctomycetota bacterium]|jgi:pSer/pThr/pTyr-binding forkhead associated (FHA) protein
MPSARPELLVVAGPAKGARAVLMTDTVTVGRSASCDVRIPEQSVSRHQLTFTADPEGWLVENVSKQTIRINDKN